MDAGRHVSNHDVLKEALRNQESKKKKNKQKNKKKKQKKNTHRTVSQSRQKCGMCHFLMRLLLLLFVGS